MLHGQSPNNEEHETIRLIRLPGERKSVVCRHPGQKSSLNFTKQIPGLVGTARLISFNHLGISATNNAGGTEIRRNRAALGLGKQGNQSDVLSQKLLPTRISIYSNVIAPSTLVP